MLCSQTNARKRQPKRDARSCCSDAHLIKRRGRMLLASLQIRLPSLQPPPPPHRCFTHAIIAVLVWWSFLGCVVCTERICTLDAAYQVLFEGCRLFSKTGHEKSLFKLLPSTPCWTSETTDVFRVYARVYACYVMLMLERKCSPLCRLAPELISPQ